MASETKRLRREIITVEDAELLARDRYRAMMRERHRNMTSIMKEEMELEDLDCSWFRK